MLKLNEKGDLLIPLVLVATLLAGAIGFGIWAFMGRQDYKNNTDEKIAEAVRVAEDALSIKKDAEAAEAAKNPYTTYVGPAAFGTVSIAHPKTWGVYADERGTGSEPLNGFMHPDYVPADSNSVNYALRFQVLEQPYDTVLKQYESMLKQGKVAAAGYRLPKVDSVAGSRLEGEITSTRKQGVLIILPLRDKTVKIWTEGDKFRADFEEILKQLTFVP